MDIPGEKLIIKLWETITEKGIGNFLQPWHEKRVGENRLELRKKEIIAIAEAERMAEDIRKGNVQFENPRLENFRDKQGDKIEPSLAIENICFNVQRNDMVDLVRKEVNLSKVILLAEEQLASDTSEPIADDIDDDWLYKWKDYASNVSSEQLQQLWGSILAGEVKKPGTFSYRSLDFLKNISKEDAKLIEAAAPFIISGRIFRNQNQYLEKSGLNFLKLLYLQEIGILSGVEAVGLTTNWKSDLTNEFQKVLISHEKCLILKNHLQSKEAPAETYLVTRVGMEIIQLAKVNANYLYLKSIGEFFKAQGFDVTIADWIQKDDASGRYYNGIQI